MKGHLRVSNEMFSALGILITFWLFHKQPALLYFGIYDKIRFSGQKFW